MPVAGAIDEVNTQKKPEYVSTMNLYVKNIDKNDKNTYRTIYQAMFAPYFVEVNLFPTSFLYHCRNHINEPQNISTDIKKNI